MKETTAQKSNSNFASGSGAWSWALPELIAPQLSFLSMLPRHYQINIIRECVVKEQGDAS